MYRKKPTPYEYMIMAADAYDVCEDEHEKYLGLIHKKDSKWRRGETHRDELTSVRIQTFINKVTKQIVLAFRGTETGGSWTELYHTLIVADGDAVIGGDFKGHATKAMQLVFSDEIIILITEGYQLSFTGHSLGGFLTEGVMDLYSYPVFQKQ